MQYLGGKTRLAKDITAILEEARAPGQQYLEPFVGGGSIICAMSGPRIACDMNQALITMWTAVRDGWEPPTRISIDDWKWHRAIQDPLDPVTAFVGCGCSFAGQWFGAFARNKRGITTDDFAEKPARSLRKQRPKIQGVDFRWSSYLDLDPHGMLVYCDPPYVNTAGYKATGEFDTPLFWETMYRWAQDNTVFVSEFEAPDDFSIEPVWSKTRLITVSDKAYNRTKTDYLYRVHP